jgi:hypothetical protein
MSAAVEYRALVAALAEEVGGPTGDALAPPPPGPPDQGPPPGEPAPAPEPAAEQAPAAAGAPMVATPGAGPAPLFLAEVDPIDTSAVMGLLAFVPSPDGSSLRAFERKMGGWVEAPEYVQKVKGLTPPPLVEMDLPTLIEVVKQMDEYDLGRQNG